MQNQEIIKIIENLKGRKNYEQRKATKLGFPSLYAYFEDKILKEKLLNLSPKEITTPFKIDNVWHIIILQNKHQTYETSSYLSALLIL